MNKIIRKTIFILLTMVILAIALFLPGLLRRGGSGREKEEKPEAEGISILCAGDNLIHLALVRNGTSADGLYERLAPMIREADVAAINLETILVSDPGAVSDYPRFGTPLTVGEALVDAGFDIVNLANNHVMYKGSYGFKVTRDFFRENGILMTGACHEETYDEEADSRIAYLEKDGIKLAYLGFTYGTNGMPMPDECPCLVETMEDRERMASLLDHARSSADIVIVYAHWGTEYEKEPDAEQRELASFFAEHGADVVIGTHPHVLQEEEEIKDKKSGHKTYVYYSLGNFISAQTKEGTKTGGLACFRARKNEDGSVVLKDFKLLKVHTVKENGAYHVELE